MSLFPASENVPSPTEIKEQLIEQGYANIPFSLGHAACSELFAHFEHFVQLCSEPGGKIFEKAVEYKAHNLDNGHYFYEHREPGINKNEPHRAAGRDHKHVYHYGPRSIMEAKNALGRSLPTDLKDFLEICDEFYSEGSKVLRVSAAALGIVQVLFNGKRTDEVHHLRVIDYLPSAESNLGVAHFDRSVMTAALNESSSGLRGVKGQNGYLEPVTISYMEELQSQLSPIDHHEFLAKVFAGAGINHLPEWQRKKAEKIPLLGHDITNEHPGERRQSVVMFANPHIHYPDYKVPDSVSETGFDDIIEHLKKKIA